MDTSILISIVGAISAIVVSLVGAWLTNRNSIILQNRKLKEEYYSEYLEALHNLLSENKNITFLKAYTLARTNLFLIGNETVIKQLLIYEEKTVGKETKLHNKYLTQLIISIRKDLNIKDKEFPEVYFQKAQ